jgi:hypothetical protein
MTCSAASANRSRPDAPIGLELSTPPDGLTGSRPPMAVSPASVSRHPFPGAAKPIQDFYLAGDKKSAIAAVPTKMVEDVALVGPWAKIADEIQRWKQTVLTTFSVHCDARHLEKVAALVR